MLLIPPLLLKLLLIWELRMWCEYCHLTACLDCSLVCCLRRNVLLICFCLVPLTNMTRLNASLVSCLTRRIWQLHLDLLRYNLVNFELLPVRVSLLWLVLMLWLTTRVKLLSQLRVHNTSTRSYLLSACCMYCFSSSVARGDSSSWNIIWFLPYRTGGGKYGHYCAHLGALWAYSISILCT